MTLLSEGGGGKLIALREGGGGKSNGNGGKSKVGMGRGGRSNIGGGGKGLLMSPIGGGGRDPPPEFRFNALVFCPPLFPICFQSSARAFLKSY